MKKILFLSIASLGFFGLDADAGIFNKKKSKVVSSCNVGSSCASCKSSKAVVAAPTKAQAPVVPQKKVQAPSPVKSQAPVAPKVTIEKKKVAAPQQ